MFDHVVRLKIKTAACEWQKAVLADTVTVALVVYVAATLLRPPEVIYWASTSLLNTKIFKNRTHVERYPDPPLD